MEDKVRVYVRPNGVFLKVIPDSGACVPDATAALKALSILDYSGEAIAKAFHEELGKEVQVAKRIVEQDRPSEMSIKISDDNLQCSIKMTRPLGKPWYDASYLKFYLKEHGVIEGIKEDALANMAQKKIIDEWVQVAQGKPAIDGKDAQIIYKLEISGAKPREQGTDKKIDLKALGTVVNVLKGQALAEKIPIVEGVGGVDIKGRFLKAAPGKDKNLPAGSGTEIAEDKLTLNAAVDGHVSVKDGKIHVNPIFEVSGDVDYSVGNVQFVGPVHVKGAVREGFEVKASGDLFIDGVVEGATLETDGNMNIKIGVRGIGKADLRAKLDINCGYIDQSRVRAGGNIVVNEAILHSDVGARGTIQALGAKKGQIVGGKVQAGQEIVCDSLGSEMGTKTEVVVGVFPELIEERKQLQEAQKDMLSKMKEIEGNLVFLKKAEAAGSLDEPKRHLMLRLTRAKFQIQSQLSIIENRLNAIEEEVEKSKTSGKIRIRNKCYQGVLVQIRGTSYIVRDTLHYTSFQLIDGEIKLGSYE